MENGTNMHIPEDHLGFIEEALNANFEGCDKINYLLQKNSSTVLTCTTYKMNE